jgi:hypothetical protein
MFVCARTLARDLAAADGPRSESRGIGRRDGRADGLPAPPPMRADGRTDGNPSSRRPIDRRGLRLGCVVRSAGFRGREPDGARLGRRQTGGRNGEHRARILASRAGDRTREGRFARHAGARPRRGSGAPGHPARSSAHAGPGTDEVGWRGRRRPRRGRRRGGGGRRVGHVPGRAATRFARAGWTARADVGRVAGQRRCGRPCPAEPEGKRHNHARSTSGPPRQVSEASALAGALEHGCRSDQSDHGSDRQSAGRHDGQSTAWPRPAESKSPKKSIRRREVGGDRQGLAWPTCAGYGARACESLLGCDQDLSRPFLFPGAVATGRGEGSWQTAGDWSPRDWGARCLALFEETTDDGSTTS